MISAYSDFLGFHPDPLLEHYIDIMPPPQLAPQIILPALHRFPARAFLASEKEPAGNCRSSSLLPSIKMDNNGMVASVAGAFMLFAGTTWLVTPGTDTERQPIKVVAEMPAAVEDSAPKIVTQFVQKLTSRSLTSGDASTSR